MSAPVPLPPQPAGLDWPSHDWPRGAPPAGFREPAEGDLGKTHALVVIWRGRLVHERYGPEHGPDSSLISWSVAKSFLHAAVGILVRDGKLATQAPADVPEWQSPGDARRAITLEQLLRMSSGLFWREDYVDAERSDVIEMLFGEGKADVAGFAASYPLEHAPGTVWNYSSGTSNLISRIAGRALGGGDSTAGFLRRALFEPLGMRSATARCDEAGTWIGSSFVFASARDFARFGYLYLRDGLWDGERILPEGWVDHARRVTPGSAEDLQAYGAHWWLPPGDEGMFSANGYAGQYLFVAPARDVVVVRLGQSSAEQAPHVRAWLRALVSLFPRL
ncbi:MAG TPA: serine hydrolase [Myxococcota bacterium]|nr:serine hydrolase [Myxococcota bacterium]